MYGLRLANARSFMQVKRLKLNGLSLPSVRDVREKAQIRARSAPDLLEFGRQGKAALSHDSQSTCSVFRALYDTFRSYS
jgi:hypothetical protein